MSSEAKPLESTSEIDRTIQSRLAWSIDAMMKAKARQLGITPCQYLIDTVGHSPYTASHQDEIDGIFSCIRCDRELVDDVDRCVWESRHAIVIGFFRYWFFRRWLPEICPTCGKRLNQCDSDNCLPF